MKNSQIVSLSIFLTVICAIASAVLAIANQATAKDIAKMKIQKTEQALKLVLGEFDNNPAQGATTVKHEGRDVTFYPALKDEKLTSFAATSSSPKGYGGNITVMTQIMPDGNIGTVIVTENNETPGLGTVATNRTRTKSISDLISGKNDSSMPPNPVLDSFKDKNCSTSPWKIKKDGGNIDSITGATISSLAVTDAVNCAAIAFESNKNELLSKFNKSQENSSPK